MRKNKKKNYIGLGLLFLIGLSILLYPMVSDAWNRYRDSLLISNYSSSVSSDENSEKIDSMWKAAQEYNEQIKQESVPDAFSVRDGQTDSTYESLLNLNGDGMMGYVDIPVIDVSIPIYHYTTDESLEKGAGHLFGKQSSGWRQEYPLYFVGTQRTSKCETFYRSESCGRGRCFLPACAG